MKNRYYIFLISAIICCIQIKAQDYNSILNSLISNNPEIAALSAAHESEIEAVKSDNNLPDPEVGFEHHWGQDGIGNKWSVGVSQRIEWPGIYNVRKNAIKSRSRALQYLYESTYNDKLLEGKLLLIDIIKTKKELSLMEETLRQMSMLKSKYHDAYRLGEASILDVNKTDIEYISISRKCNALKNQMETLKSSLITFNGGKSCTDIISLLEEYPQERLLSEDEYAELINKNDPFMHYNDLMLKAQTLSTKAAKMSRMPDLTLGYSHTNELGAHFNAIKIGISLPFFSKRHKAEAAYKLQESYEMEALSTKVNRMAMMYGDRANAITLKKEIDEYRTIFESGNNTELLRKAFDGGEISLLEYLQELNYFLSARQDYMNTVYQYHYILARLNRYADN